MIRIVPSQFKIATYGPEKAYCTEGCQKYTHWDHWKWTFVSSKWNLYARSDVNSTSATWLSSESIEQNIFQQRNFGQDPSRFNAILRFSTFNNVPLQLAIPCLNAGTKKNLIWISIFPPCRIYCRYLQKINMDEKRKKLLKYQKYFKWKKFSWINN